MLGSMRSATSPGRAVPPPRPRPRETSAALLPARTAAPTRALMSLSLAASHARASGEGADAARGWPRFPLQGPLLALRHFEIWGVAMMRVLALMCAVVVAVAMVPLAALADTPTPRAATTTTATATATGTGTATATATRTATPTATPVADAAAFRDQLLATAMANLAEADSRTFLGFFTAWSTQFPGLNGSGSAINAGPGTVSVRWNYINDKGTPGASNPQTITFAVSGNGRCEGAVIYGFPKPTTAAKVSLSSSACSADAVVASFRDRKSTRLNSSHSRASRMPSSA